MAFENNAALFAVSTGGLALDRMGDDMMRYECNFLFSINYISSYQPYRNKRLLVTYF